MGYMSSTGLLLKVVFSEVILLALLGSIGWEWNQIPLHIYFQIPADIWPDIQLYNAHLCESTIKTSNSLIGIMGRMRDFIRINLCWENWNQIESLLDQIITSPLPKERSSVKDIPLMKTRHTLSMWWIASLREQLLSGCPFLPPVSHHLGPLLSHPAIMS